ncbi:hypothetical protein DPMN_108663, partial [Dreissena polymorpha]
IAPVLMSQSLLERLKNNFMIIEVWDKKTSADNDKLVGIVKLSLHQFYMSFRDKRISSALLKSQYPVIAVENYLPVVDVFSGSQYGQINVLLAMGSAEQVAHLVRMKTEGVPGTSIPERPQHFLERQDLLHQGETVPAQIGTEAVVEHIFEIVIEGVRGLTMEDMIWGEADCFVQYHFPAQQQTAPPGAPVIRHAVPTMKAFRTATTLCIADPTFHDVTRHRILLPQGTPVQRELLTACGNSGSGGGGLPFELWCRYYHPNVRDQCMAKANLPLAKLCAMVTMQKRGEPSVQTFSFPLQHVGGGGSPGNERQNAGLIDVTIHYKNQAVQSETGVAAANKNLSGAQVCVSVGVLRACGLKAAAEIAASHDQGMQYPAEVGVNTYIRVKLTFLGSEGERITRTVARSFAPEFSHFMDFPCPLLWTEANSDAMCLAELLETAEASFEVWHQVPGMSPELDRELNALMAEGTVKGRNLVEKTGDVLLGTTTLPLVMLLSNRTGINGWFPIKIPVSAWNQSDNDREPDEVRPGTSGLSRVGGGLEISVKFAHHEDRERVIHAARGVGWSPVDLDVEQDDWESEDEDSNRYHHVSITIDQVSFPLQNALIAGQNTLDKTAQCYVRYKFYDKAAVMSKFCPVSVTSDGYITAQPKNRHDLQIPDSSMFRWYLREERLEVQLWVTYGARQGDTERPRHRDKLIGTAYVAMETLGDQRRKQHRVSGMFPLFKPGACSLGGGYIRAHITTKPQFGRKQQSEGQEGLITLDGEDIDVDYDPDDSFHQIVSRKPSRPSSPAKEVKKGAEVTTMEESEEKETTPTFTAVVQVERALHLPHMHDKLKGEDYLPNTYVSYPTAESAIQSYTSIFHGADNPVWDHEHETCLSTEMLTQENKHLVFKVWHKPDGAPKSPDKLTDRVLGFVSVDLTPLASGLQQISGWYNIMDFNGQIKGQIKINILPQETVIPSSQCATTSGTNMESVSSGFLSLPAWSAQSVPYAAHGPLSLPVFDLPHFDQHYQQVRQHHEMLQQQLQEHIQQFLRQQEECQGQGHASGSRSNEIPGSRTVSMVAPGKPDVPTSVPDPSDFRREPSMYQREPSIHWRPSIPEMRQDDSSSRSYLFSSLRKQMQDLDDITYKLKTKLTCQTTDSNPQASGPTRSSEFDFPTTTQSIQYPLTSTQSDFGSFDLPRSQRETPRDELTTTLGSHGEESSRTQGDSGQRSVEYSGEKFHDDSAPISQRSARSSERLDTLRSGVTPRDFLDSGIPNTNNNSNTEEPEQNMWLTISPRDSNEKDEYSESGGFNYRRSPRDAIRTPRESVQMPREPVTTPRDFDQVLTQDMAQNIQHHIDNARKLLPDVQDQKQMSVIQEYSENDRSESESEDEADNKYYHRYRDLLDTKQNDSDKEDENDDEDEEVEDEYDEGDVVVPRRINDVSGKFSPTGEIVMLSEDLEMSMPFRSAKNAPSKTSSSQKKLHHNDPASLQNNQVESPRDEIQEVESDSEPEPRANDSVHMTDQEQVVFDERDSWLSDSDKEGESVVGYGHHLRNHAGLAKQKQQRQDSDTGYSSRDNVSESYLTPSAPGTNSETDMSRLHEHEHWSDHRDSAEEHAFIDRRKNRLLANVELESTGGSFGIRTQSGPTRISSAGSRKCRISSEPSVTESFDEKEEQDNVKHKMEPINSEHDINEPLSARTRELDDFFKADANQKMNGEIHRSRSGSESSRDYFVEDEDNSNYQSDNERPRVNRHAQNLAKSSQSKGGNSGDNFTKGVGGSKPMPNFFMPAHHLEESMQTLKNFTNKDPSQESAKAAATSEMLARLTAKEKFSQSNTKGRLPTADETKRIAKIFGAKFS